LHPAAILVFHSAVQFSVHLSARKRDVERWSKGDVSASLVKSNGAREVWRVAVGSPALYVKRFPAELLRDRAKIEAELLGALEKSHIPCPRLVAVARDQKGSYILTEEIPDSQPLSDLLRNRDLDARSLMEDLGKLARSLHDAGFDHQDFHAGNVLVRDGALYVIDVHRARRGRALSADRRLDSVAFTAMSFVETRPLSDVLRFFRAYGLDDRAEWADAWARLRKRHHEYHEGRQKRCFKDGTGFGVDGRLYYRKDADVLELRKKLYHATRSTVRRTKTESLHRVDGGYFLKTTTASRAKRIWEHAHGLAVRGIDTPRLLLWEGRQVAGEWVESLDLHDFIRLTYGSLPRVDQLDFLRRLARVVRRLHDRGVYHADLKGGNILVGSGRLLVIDLDRVRFTQDVPEKDRLYNLAQLNASVTPPLTRTDRLRFLDFYMGNCASLRAERRRWVGAVMKLTRARKHRWPGGA
jgi:tRNA A-37 threonylcarbamoyl transferase component Bud32